MTDQQIEKKNADRRAVRHLIEEALIDMPATRAQLLHELGLSSCDAEHAVVLAVAAKNEWLAASEEFVRQARNVIYAKAVDAGLAR